MGDLIGSLVGNVRYIDIIRQHGVQQTYLSNLSYFVGILSAAKTMLHVFSNSINLKTTKPWLDVSMFVAQESPHKTLTPLCSNASPCCLPCRDLDLTQIYRLSSADLCGPNPAIWPIWLLARRSPFYDTVPRPFPSRHG